jgi:SAM-dependent methyltransferase
MLYLTSSGRKKTIGTPASITALRKSLRPLRRMYTSALRTNKLRRSRRILCSSEDLSPDQLRAFALESPLSDAEKRLVRRVSLKVSASDDMYVDGWSTSYLTGGLSAGREIRASLDAAGKVIAKGVVLDFPCGYGRVLRLLKEMFPDSQIVGAEIDAAALNFCRRTFSVQGYASSPARGLRSLSLPHRFDLIWCGSLITHIDESAAVDLLDFFCRHLADRGVCVFTTLGQKAASGMMAKKEKRSELSEQGVEKLLRDYHEKGYGYTDYSWADASSSGSNGLSLTSRSRIIEMARSVGRWEPVYYRESGWHELQDVYAFRLSGPDVQHP